MSQRLGIAAAAAFIATVWLANYLIVTVGIVHVGFGLMAPAGVYAAGLAFTLRDIVQRTLGRDVVVLCIITGAAVSYLIAPAFAFASAVAFLVSELADFAIYTPLSKKTWAGAVTLSNTVGAMVDSFLFLTIAFGSLEFFWGQVVGKMWITLAAVAVLAAVGRRRALLVGNA